MSSGVAYLLKKHKVAVISGTARLKGKGVIAVTGKDGKPLADLEAKHIIMATGARARSLPGLEPDGKLIWTYKEAMVPGRRRNRCWSWARALSASNSRAFTMRSV